MCDAAPSNLQIPFIDFSTTLGYEYYGAKGSLALTVRGQSGLEPGAPALSSLPLPSQSVLPHPAVSAFPGFLPGLQPQAPLPPTPTPTLLLPPPLLPHLLPSPSSSAPPPPPQRPRSPNTRHLEQQQPPRSLGLITGRPLSRRASHYFISKNPQRNPSAADNRK